MANLFISLCFFFLVALGVELRASHLLLARLALLLLESLHQAPQFVSFPPLYSDEEAEKGEKEEISPSKPASPRKV
jgi:hypothetical protein